MTATCPLTKIAVVGRFHPRCCYSELSQQRGAARWSTARLAARRMDFAGRLLCTPLAETLAITLTEAQLYDRFSSPGRPAKFTAIGQGLVGK